MNIEVHTLGPQAAAFRPLYDRLLVKTLPEHSTFGSLILPEIAQRPGALGGDKFLRTGVVIAVGPGDRVRTLPNGNLRLIHRDGSPLKPFVQPGDIVQYDHPSDRVIRLDEEEYVVIREEQHVLAVLENDSSEAWDWDPPGYSHGHPDYEG